jgi:adenylosuccinate synthase
VSGAHRAIQVVDLGFGDAGKGTMVDYLVRRHESDLVVRFNGGPQAGHNVVLPDGRHHTFAQFGSGSFVPGVRTLLSRFMLIEPYAMLNEARHLESVGVPDAMRRTFVDGRCLVITPPQQIANRIRERARGADAHGTCGMGVGECVADDLANPELSVFALDLSDRTLVRRKLQAILDHKRLELAPLLVHALPEQARVLNDDSWIDTAVDTYSAVSRSANVIAPTKADTIVREARVTIFEGAQGVLLDEWFGFHPHTTWSTTTFANAGALLVEAGSPATRKRIGVTRTYMTRHGSGPFPTYRPTMSANLPEPHNADVGYQGAFRRGVLDLVLLRYAIDVCGGIDSLALTHCDRWDVIPSEVCDGYEIDGSRIGTLPRPAAGDLAAMQKLGSEIATARLIEMSLPDDRSRRIDVIEDRLATPCSIVSDGPTYAHKHCRA